MHFNIYLDDETGMRLNQLAERRGRSRNSVIHEAVADLLERQPNGGWPQEVREFKGLPDMPSFESYRDELTMTNADPLK